MRQRKASACALFGLLCPALERLALLGAQQNLGRRPPTSRHHCLLCVILREEFVVMRRFTAN